jgi:hypothetical protein
MALRPESPAGAVSGALVLAVDDAALGESLLGWSTALASGLGRELALVYVESAAALGAAALPLAQVLPHAGAAWQPLRRDDVELGFRAQAARLRGALEAAALRHALGWSFRVMRGSLLELPEQLWAETNLLCLAAAPLASPRVPPRPGARRPVVALGDDGGAGERTVDMALRVAQALAAELQRDGQVLAPDLMVMTRRARRLDLRVLQRCPVLLVD